MDRHFRVQVPTEKSKEKEMTEKEYITLTRTINERNEVIKERDALTDKLDAIREWICAEYWNNLNPIHEGIYDSQWIETENHTLYNIYQLFISKGWR